MDYDSREIQQTSGTGSTVTAQNEPPLESAATVQPLALANDPTREGSDFATQSEEVASQSVTINININVERNPSKSARDAASRPQRPAESQRGISLNVPQGGRLTRVASGDLFPKVCVDLDIRKFGRNAPFIAMKHAIQTNDANIPNVQHPAAKDVIDTIKAGTVDKLGPLGGLAAYMALLTGKKWSPGQQLFIGFLNGSQTQQSRATAHAKEWLNYANIQFEFTGSQQGNIRVAFGPDPGSWSAIGTDCMAVPNDQPTMNFGWLLDATDDVEYNRVVVHEFGHALGCIHEHQNPAGGIQWNKPVVYAYYEGPPNNWTPEAVDLNIFNTYDKNITNYTAVDPLSIMMYPIPANFTTNGFQVGWNTDLSATDKSFIAQNYPGQ